MESQLARRGIRHVSLARLVRLDTRWRAQQWPDAPTGPLDPAYAESLALAEQTFETVASGRRLDAMTVRDLVELLIYRSRAATRRSARFSPSSSTRTSPTAIR